MGVSEYIRQLFALLPPGRLWSHDGLLAGLISAIAEEFSLIDTRATEGLKESDPRTATETRDRWENKYNLPSSGTDTERTARIVSRVIRKQRTRPVDYREKFAALLGYTDPNDVTVIERSRADAIAMDDDQEIYRFFLYRDPTDPGTYSVEDAQALLDTFVHSHTKGHVIESINFLCDDPYSLCDRDILGI